MASNVTIYAGLGWCFSELFNGDLEPAVSVSSALECWDACQEEYPATIASDFYENTQLCFCQEACDCLESDNSNVELVVFEDFVLPEACSDLVEDDDSVDATLQVLSGRGWCSSDLDEQLSAVVESPQACWDACTSLYGEDTIVAVDFYQDAGSCYCQDDCQCIFESDEALLVVPFDFDIPVANCEDGGTTNDDYSYFDDNSTISCNDSATWFAEDDPNKDCRWVARRKASRCDDIGVDNTWAFEACRESCDACPRGCRGTFPDSTTWRLRSDSTKDCAWVGEYSSVRCRLRDADDLHAWKACPFSCHTCEYFIGGCDDDQDWRADDDDDDHDCDWVAEISTSRCTTVGADGFRAFESCRRACGSCKTLLTGTCTNNSTFYKKDEPFKTCDEWVDQFPDLVSSRCSVKGDDGAWAYNECALACGTC